VKWERQIRPHPLQLIFPARQTPQPPFFFVVGVPRDRTRNLDRHFPFWDSLIFPSPDGSTSIARKCVALVVPPRGFSSRSSLFFRCSQPSPCVIELPRTPPFDALRLEGCRGYQYEAQCASTRPGPPSFPSTCRATPDYYEAVPHLAGCGGKNSPELLLSCHLSSPQHFS